MKEFLVEKHDVSGIKSRVAMMMASLNRRWRTAMLMVKLIDEGAIARSHFDV